MQPKEKPKKKILLTLLFLCQIAFAQNYSLSFDGVDDYVDMGDPVDGDLDVGDSDFTLEAFIKVSDGQIDTYGSLISKRYGEQGNGYALIINNAGNVCAEILKLGAGNGYTEFCGNVNVVDAQWNHISVVFDRDDNATIYINGIIDASENITEQIGNIDNDMVFKIGDKSTGSRHYNGLIDNVRIWKRALTQSDIQSYMSTPPTGNEEGLVGYWNFNEGTGTTASDATSNGNDGTIYGATWSTDVPVSGCTDPYADNYDSDATLDDGSCAGYPDNGDYSLSFDGDDDYVEISVSETSLGTQATISAWVKKDVWETGSDVTATVIDLYNSSDINGQRDIFTIKYWSENEKLNAMMRAGTWYNAAADINYNSDQWYHIIIVRNSTSLKIYINGSETGSNESVGGNNFDNYDRIRIGSSATSENWDDTIDEVAIWNDALTASEITAIYNSGNGLDASSNSGNYTSSSNLESYWKFDAGTGSTLYDHSGNANHGTIVGATWSTDVPITQTYVPDNNFEQALIDLGYDDTLDDYVLTANISGVTILYIAD
jgi:hypothetical protein